MTKSIRKIAILSSLIVLISHFFYIPHIYANDKRAHLSSVKQQKVVEKKRYNKKQSSNSKANKEEAIGVKKENRSQNLFINDDKALYMAFKYALKKDWQKALENAALSKDPKFAEAAITAIKIYQEPSGTSIQNISKFLSENPWLPSDIYEKKIDKIISPDYKADEILIWYGSNEPISNKGKILLIDAQIKRKILDASDPNVKKSIRALWRSSEFDMSIEEYFISEYSNIITVQDCLDKIDKLSWNKSFSLANNLISILPQELRDVPQKRLSLLRKITEEQVFTSISDPSLNDIYTYFKVSRLIKDSQYEKATDTLISMKKRSSSPERWWKLTNILVREAIEKKEYKKAFNLLKSHNLKPGADYAEAEFLSGWIALRFLDSPADALEHFHNLYENSKLANTKSKAAYWLGRTYEASGDREKAQKWYSDSSKYIATFYGHLALATIKKSAKVNYFDYTYNVNSGSKKSPKDKQTLQKAVMFAYYLFKNDQKIFAYSILNSIPGLDVGNGEIGNALSFFNKRSLYPLSVELGRAYSNKAFITIKDSYPKNIKIVLNKLDKSIYYAIMRQESNFDQSAVSSAGATGLMQLMPATAESMALILKLPKSSYRTDADSNVLKGVAYIDQLYTQFDSYILTIAAYNAGPGNVRKWLYKFGDIRDRDNLYEKIDWIEMIPFSETRNYVKKVVENMLIYDYMLSPSHNSLTVHKILR